jgi:hypothetical protein
MAKMLFDLQRGLIEIEGEEQFVEKVYNDLRATLSHKVANYSALLPDPETAIAEPSTSDEPKKTRKRSKSSGPSCASRIDALKSDKFFDQLRTAKEVTDKLRQKGTAYEGKRVAAALLNLTSSGKLRRIEEDSVWKYQNP